jgi:hypothetical protein
MPRAEADVAGPAGLGYAFAGLMIVTSAYCISRLVLSRRRRRRPTDRDVDAVHVLMGIAMAGMLVPRLRVFWVGGWEVVFGVAAAWFTWQAIRGRRRPAASGGPVHHLGQVNRRRGQTAGRGPGHHAQHALACVAMLYMLLALTSVGAVAAAHAGHPMDGMTGSPGRLPTLALVLAIALLGYVAWTADRLSSLAPVAAAPVGSAVPALARLTPIAHLEAGARAEGADGAGRRMTGAGTAGAGTADASPANGASGSSRGVPPAAAWRPPVSPRLAAGCEIAMGVTMGYMLILML